MQLWRPVGMRELVLVWEAGFRGFPPRLPEQPIFYPVLDREYAVQIARDWNTKEDPYAGYVTAFELEDGYASRFEIRVVGGRQHRELWVPAKELETFNSRLREAIRVECAYFGSRFRGFVPRSSDSRDAMLGSSSRPWRRSVHTLRWIFYLETRANELALYLNFPFWLTSTAAELGTSEAERTATLDQIRRCWSVAEVRSPLIETAARAT